MVNITDMNMIDLGESSELDLSSPMFPDNKSKYPLMAQFWVEFQMDWNPILILLLFLCEHGYALSLLCASSFPADLCLIYS